jgi:hypothetical protein
VSKYDPASISRLFQFVDSVATADLNDVIDGRPIEHLAWLSSTMKTE